MNGFQGVADGSLLRSANLEGFNFGTFGAIWPTFGLLVGWCSLLKGDTQAKAAWLVNCGVMRWDRLFLSGKVRQIYSQSIFYGFCETCVSSHIKMVGR